MQEQNMTGYPSIDKPWLKYYSDEAINAPLPECSIFDHLWDKNKNDLNSIAILYYGSRISYKCLFDKIQETANALYACGVRKDDIVAVCLPSIPEAVYLIYALNYIGAIPNMLDPRYNEKLLEFCVKETPTKLLLTLDLCYEKFLKSDSDVLPKQIVLISAFQSMGFPLETVLRAKSKTIKPKRNHDLSWKQFLRNGLSISAEKDSETDPHVCRFILHTGGTTGNPKGVMLSNIAINAIARQYWWTGYGNHSRGQTILEIIPPFASYGISASIHMPLCSGVSLRMIPKFDTEKFGDLVAKYKPTYIAGVPSFFENMIKSKKLEKADLSYMVSLGCGGDSMSIEQERRINAFLEERHSNGRIDKGYGMSEVAATACVCSGNVRKEGSIGAPFVNTTIKVIDPETYEELSYGQTGEICISGPGMMIGYYGNEELTNKTIKKHKDGIKWVHTGDLGHMDEDGFLFHDGRIKRMIVRFDGFKVYPEAVESAVIRSSFVRDCAVVKKNKEGLGIIVKAFILLNETNESEENIWKDILNHCQQDLAERAIPQEYEFVDTLPYTSMGKIDYLALENK
ncbi:MAG: acyl--CoA ligase [Clostridia bacterium]|nr:acyl--CoA ligase [Clostridia bacterium]